MRDFYCILVCLQFSVSCDQDKGVADRVLEKHKRNVAADTENDEEEGDDDDDNDDVDNDDDDKLTVYIKFNLLLIHTCILHTLLGWTLFNTAIALSLSSFRLFSSSTTTSVLSFSALSPV